MRKIFRVFIVILVIIGLVGCQPATKGSNNGQQYSGKIRIAYQIGLSYAPYQVMEEKKLVEKYLPGVEVEYTRLTAGALVGEALDSGSADVGVLGSVNILTGWDKGARYKLLSGLICLPLGIVTFDESKSSLNDFTEKDKIAVTNPNSPQGVLLAMESENQFGDPNALKNNQVSMPHTEAMASLINRINLTAHYATPPYLYEEIEEGGNLLVSASETFGGDFTFVATAATEDFVTNRPAHAGAVFMALSEAIDLVNTRDPEAIKIISERENLSEEKVIKYLDWEGTNFSTTPYGFMGVAKYMHKINLLSKVPESIRDIAWPIATSIVGQRSGEASVVERAQERGQK